MDHLVVTASPDNIAPPTGLAAKGAPLMQGATGTVVGVEMDNKRLVVGTHPLLFATPRLPVVSVSRRLVRSRCRWPGTSETTSVVVA